MADEEKKEEKTDEKVEEPKLDEQVEESPLEEEVENETKNEEKKELEDVPEYEPPKEEVVPPGLESENEWIKKGAIVTKAVQKLL